MRPNAGFASQVGHPQDIRVGRPDGNELRALWRLVAGFIGERPVVAVSHAVDVEAEDLCAVVEEIDTLGLDDCRRRDSNPWPIQIGIAADFWNDELPQELAGIFIETEENAAVAGVPRVARRIIVCADEDPSAGDDGRGVALGAEARGPLDALLGGWVNHVGQMSFATNRVTGEALAGLRRIRRACRCTADQPSGCDKSANN